MRWKYPPFPHYLQQCDSHRNYDVLCSVPLQPRKRTCTSFSLIRTLLGTLFGTFLIRSTSPEAAFLSAPGRKSSVTAVRVTAFTLSTFILWATWTGAAFIKSIVFVVRGLRCGPCGLCWPFQCCSKRHFTFGLMSGVRVSVLKIWVRYFCLWRTWLIRWFCGSWGSWRFSCCISGGLWSVCWIRSFWGFSLRIFSFPFYLKRVTSTYLCLIYLVLERTSSREVSLRLMLRTLLTVFYSLFFM